MYLMLVQADPEFQMGHFSQGQRMGSSISDGAVWRRPVLDRRGGRLSPLFYLDPPMKGRHGLHHRYPDKSLHLRKVLRKGPGTVRRPIQSLLGSCSPPMGAITTVYFRTHLLFDCDCVKHRRIEGAQTHVQPPLDRAPAPHPPPPP